MFASLSERCHFIDARLLLYYCYNSKVVKYWNTPVRLPFSWPAVLDYCIGEKPEGVRWASVGRIHQSSSQVLLNIIN